MSMSAEKSYRKLLWILVLLGVTLDQTSKYTVFRWLYNEARGDECVVFSGVFKFIAEYPKGGNRKPLNVSPPENALRPLRTLSGEFLPSVNQGALFGFLRDYKMLANGIFAVVSIVAAGAISYWSTRPATARDPVLCASLGLILAGTLGNLYDRLVFQGVRDFLYFHWFEFPVFNVADSCLVCGAFLLVAHSYFHRPAAAPELTPEVALSSVAAGSAAHR
jgi:lipoprotein signal peptidase